MAKKSTSSSGTRSSSTRSNPKNVLSGTGGALQDALIVTGGLIGASVVAHFAGRLVPASAPNLLRKGVQFGIPVLAGVYLINTGKKGSIKSQIGQGMTIAPASWLATSVIGTVAPAATGDGVGRPSGHRSRGLLGPGQPRIPVHVMPRTTPQGQPSILALT